MVCEGTINKTVTMYLHHVPYLETLQLHDPKKLHPCVVRWKQAFYFMHSPFR